MTIPPADPRATARPAGLTDTIWAGFDLIHRHVWLLILPVAVDILMWWGPQLSVAPIVDSWSASAAGPAAGDDVLARSIDDARSELLRSGETLKRYNLVSLLAVPVLGLPSARAGLSGVGPTLPIQSEAGASLIVVGTVLLGVILAAVYYGLLGHLVREGTLRARQFARDLPTVLSAVITLFGMLILVGMVIGIPIGALLSVMQAASPALAGLVGPIIVGVLLWAVVYLFFTVDAVYVSQVWPTSAVQNSIRVVRHNFWSTLGFIALVLLIGAGFPLIWDRLATTQGVLGVMLGIVGHSYISSALAAASMTYYKERFERMIASHEGSNAPVAPARG
jgi:hypothetical protein